MAISKWCKTVQASYEVKNAIVITEKSAVITPSPIVPLHTDASWNGICYLALITPTTRPLVTLQAAHLLQHAQRGL